MRALFIVLLLAVLVVIANLFAQPFTERDIAFLSRDACFYQPDNAVFSGATQYMKKVADYSDDGWGDAKTFTLSCWVKVQADGASKTIFNIANSSVVDRMYLIVGTDGRLVINGMQFSGALVLAMLSTNTFTVAKGWQHLFVCINVADATQTKIYINGVLDATNTQTRVDAGIDQAGINYQYFMGAYHGNAFPMNGALSEFWFNDTYLDNPTLFISNGCPVYLGTDGTGPGQTPILYFKGSNNLFNVVIGSATPEGNWGITNGPLTFTNSRPRVGAL